MRTTPGPRRNSHAKSRTARARRARSTHVRTVDFGLRGGKPIIQRRKGVRIGIFFTLVCAIVDRAADWLDCRASSVELFIEDSPSVGRYFGSCRQKAMMFLTWKFLRSSSLCPRLLGYLYRSFSGNRATTASAVRPSFLADRTSFQSSTM